MTALVIIGLIAVVALAVVWSRVGLARSERRSMESYERTLHLLGDVTRRSDAAARIRPVRREDTEHGYIRAEHPSSAPPLSSGHASEATEAAETAEADAGDGEPAHIPVPSSIFERPRIENVPVQFADDSDAFERAQEEAQRTTAIPLISGAPTAATSRIPAAASLSSGAASAPDTAPAGAPARERLEHSSRLTRLPMGRVMSIAAAVLVVVVLVLVGVTVLGKKPHPAAAGLHHHHPLHHAKVVPSTQAPTTTAPSELVPVSTSPQQVAFVAPKGTYTVLLTDTGSACWVGIQQTLNGPDVWQETLAPGQSATYQASGPLVIRIGAPQYLGVKVNGLPVRLPGYVQPYDVLFNPSTPPSSA